jgi:hypothetical protein
MKKEILCSKRVIYMSKAMLAVAWLLVGSPLQDRRSVHWLTRLGVVRGGC